MNDKEVTMTDLKEMTLGQFMGIEPGEKAILARTAFSKVTNPLIQFRYWYGAMIAWKLKHEQIVELTETLSNSNRDDDTWNFYSAILSEEAAVKVSLHEGTKALMLIKNCSPEVIGVVVELDAGAANRYVDQIAKTFHEINNHILECGATHDSFAQRMMELIENSSNCESLRSWHVDKDSLVGYFEGKVSWDYYKNPEGIYALEILANLASASLKNQTTRHEEI